MWVVAGGPGFPTAVSPVTLGGGKGLTQRNSKKRLPSSTRTSASEPPSDTDVSDGAAFAARRPLPSGTNPRFTPTQPYPFRTRSGTSEISALKDPSGFATTNIVAEVNDETSTSRP